jgi:hypothetical protein
MNAQATELQRIDENRNSGKACCSAGSGLEFRIFYRERRPLRAEGTVWAPRLLARVHWLKGEKDRTDVSRASAPRADLRQSAWSGIPDRKIRL